MTLCAAPRNSVEKTIVSQMLAIQSFIHRRSRDGWAISVHVSWFSWDCASPPLVVAWHHHSKVTQESKPFRPGLHERVRHFRNEQASAPLIRILPLCVSLLSFSLSFSFLFWARGAWLHGIGEGSAGRSRGQPFFSCKHSEG